MKIGIVIPIYNRPQLVSRMLNSLSTSYLIPTAEHRVILIDDCSYDKTTVKLMEYFVWSFLKADKTYLTTCKIWNKKNTGVWNVLRTGFDELHKEEHDVMINLDSDTVVKKNWLQKLIQYHKMFPNDIITGFNTSSHPIKASYIDYAIKDTIGGVNMAFSQLTYEEVIRPALSRERDWDWEVSWLAANTNRKLITILPSVIQHTGIESAMGHGRIDIAEDFQDEKLN